MHVQRTLYIHVHACADMEKYLEMSDKGSLIDCSCQKARQGNYCVAMAAETAAAVESKTPKTSLSNVDVTSLPLLPAAPSDVVSTESQHDALVEVVGQNL